MKGPGLILVLPVVRQAVRVDLRTRVLDVPQQDVISRDNVSVKVNAVFYYRILDAEKSVIQVEDFQRGGDKPSSRRQPCVRYWVSMNWTRCWRNG